MNFETAAAAELRSRALATFERFPHLDRSDVTIAFSGGKDSLALAHLIRSIGKRVLLRAVDMGYSPAWADRIRHMAALLDFSLEVAALRELLQEPEMNRSAQIDLANRRSYLEVIKDDYTGNVTPCTNCYNCKLIAIVYKQARADQIVYFGHHANDLISSFLKSAIMYYDRWIRGNAIFRKDSYAALAKMVGSDLIKKDSYFLDLFLEYLATGVASTEEPPYEIKNLHGSQLEIGTPLFLADENALRVYSDSLGVSVESSGCGHSTLSATRTPREIVHYEILPEVLRGRQGRVNLELLKEAILEHLNDDGTLRADARQNRDTLLGATYKGAGDFARKF